MIEPDRMVSLVAIVGSMVLLMRRRSIARLPRRDTVTLVAIWVLIFAVLTLIFRYLGAAGT